MTNLSRDLVRAAVLLIAVVLAFWAAVYFSERAARPEGLSARPWVEFQPLDEAGQPIEPGKRLRAPYFDFPIYRAEVDNRTSRATFLIPFDASRSSSELAFFLGATPGLQEIRLNGQVIQPNIPLDTLRGAADGKTLYYILPPDLLRTGKNEVEVTAESQSGILVLAPFHVGPAVEAARAANVVEVITNSVPTIAVSFLIFASLLCLVTNWPAPDRPRIRTLVMLMLVWAARTWFITFQTPFEVPFLITSFLYYFLECSLIIAFARHLLAGEGRGAKWTRWLDRLWLALIIYLAAITVAGFIVGPVVREMFKALAYLNSAMLLVVAMLGLAALAWGTAKRRDGRWLERISLMVCLLALFVDAGDAAFKLSVPFAPHLPLTFYLAAPAGLFLALGIIASIAREASEARRTVVQSNEILAARLTEQDAELARSYDAQKQMLQRQVVLEERQRIVRDMHDGIGGQLLGLMLQVRSGDVEKKQVEEGLQSSIADLRLIVDSMDTADDGLAETLRSFEHRVRAQVEAAGMTLKVEHGLDDSKPGPGPRPTLQILRILQEAVTNAMRHSSGSEIVFISRYDDDGLIRIVIKDNGTGMPADIKGGRGLASMRNRAEAVGGALEIEALEPGTSLSLTLPVPDEADRRS